MVKKKTLAFYFLFCYNEEKLFMLILTQQQREAHEEHFEKFEELGLKIILAEPRVSRKFARYIVVEK